jgi:signal transduction histidine kinase
MALSAAAYLVLVGASALHVVLDDSQYVDEATRALRAGEAAALLAVASAAAWGWARRGRTRGRVARLVLDLAATPAPGGLGDALASGLGDHTVRLGYWLTDGRLVDVNGAPVAVTDAATPLLRGGRPVALLTHRPGLLDDPRVGDEVAAAARLALDNERLQAELAAQLAHLQSSRQRIIATADATRRRLERDLHDGAQQQLVGLLLRLRLERTHWPADDPGPQDATAEVERQLQGAVDELRELARGIFPAALAEEGLGPAVEDFAEASAVPVTVTALPVRRLPDAVESAAYFVVAEAVRRSAATRATVDAVPTAGVLTVDVDLAGVVDGDGWLAALEDRVGALDGSLTVAPSGDGLSVRAVMPCGS